MWMKLWNYQNSKTLKVDNAWILLTAIFIVLITLLIYEKKKRNEANNHLNINENFVINENKVNENEVISMRLSLKGRTITLIDAVELFKSKSIQMNNKGIFEKKINDNCSYFVANLTEPGYFKNDKSIHGFTFFFLSSYEIDDKRHYEEMKKDIYEINSIFKGKIRDDSIFKNSKTDDNLI